MWKVRYLLKAMSSRTAHATGVCGPANSIVLLPSRKPACEIRDAHGNAEPTFYEISMTSALLGRIEA